MILEYQEKVHVVMRRNFQEDLRRHFIGEVQRVCDDLVRVKGYMFVYDSTIGEFVKRPNIRIQIFSMSDAGNMLAVLPDATDPEQVIYKLTENHICVLTDEVNFTIDVNEFSAKY